MLSIVLASNVEGSLGSKEAEGVADIGTGREDSQADEVVEGEAAVFEARVSLKVNIVLLVFLDICQTDLIKLRVPANSSCSRGSYPETRFPSSAADPKQRRRRASLRSEECFLLL